MTTLSLLDRAEALNDGLFTSANACTMQSAGASEKKKKKLNEGPKDSNPRVAFSCLWHGRMKSLPKHAFIKDSNHV